jgi:hypothetical protein
MIVINVNPVACSIGPISIYWYGLKDRADNKIVESLPTK